MSPQTSSSVPPDLQRSDSRTSDGGSQASSHGHSTNSSRTDLAGSGYHVQKFYSRLVVIIESSGHRFYRTFVRREPRLVVLSMFSEPKPPNGCVACALRCTTPHKKGYTLTSWLDRKPESMVTVATKIRHDDAFCSVECWDNYAGSLSSNRTFLRGCKELDACIRRVPLPKPRLICNLMI
jgi:hypothetical protein